MILTPFLRFKKEWLKFGYSDIKKVRRDRDSGILSPRVAEVLLGVHKQEESFATVPSPMDIHKLKIISGEGIC